MRQRNQQKPKSGKIDNTQSDGNNKTQKFPEQRLEDINKLCTGKDIFLAAVAGFLPIILNYLTLHYTSDFYVFGICQFLFYLIMIINYYKPGELSGVISDIYQNEQVQDFGPKWQQGLSYGYLPLFVSIVVIYFCGFGMYGHPENQVWTLPFVGLESYPRILFVVMSYFYIVLFTMQAGILEELYYKVGLYNILGRGLFAKLFGAVCQSMLQLIIWFEILKDLDLVVICVMWFVFFLHRYFGYYLLDNKGLVVSAIERLLTNLAHCIQLFLMYWLQSSHPWNNSIVLNKDNIWTRLYHWYFQV